MAGLIAADPFDTKFWQNPRRYTRELREGLGHFGAMPLVILFGLNMVDEFDRVAFGVLGPEIRDAFGLSDSAFVAIVAISGVLPILLSVPLGVLADRSNRMRIIQGGALLWAVAALSIGFIPVLSVLIVARFVGGVGKLVNEPVPPSLLADYYPAQQLPRVLGTWRFANTAGLIVSPVAGLMGKTWGYRPTFVVMTIPTLILLAISVRLREPTRGGAGSSVLAVAPTEKIPWREGFRMLASVRALRRTWMGAFFFGSGIAPVAALMALFFEEVYQLEPDARGVVALLSGVFSAIGLAWGTRLTQRAVFAGQAAKLPVVVALMIMSFAVGFILMAAAPWVLLSIAFSCLASLGITGFFPAYLVMVTFTVPPPLRSQAFSYSLLFFALGALVFSPSAGAIGDAFGYRPAIVLLSVLVAIGGSFGFSVRRFVVADIERSSRLLTDPEARKGRRQRRHEARVAAAAAGNDVAVAGDGHSDTATLAEAEAAQPERGGDATGNGAQMNDPQVRRRRRGHPAP